jgi:acetyl-CoA carboxylase biotin carboxyl carrier protein
MLGTVSMTQRKQSIREGRMADLRVRSEIAGSVWKIEVAVGDRVAEDDPLVILESMKMEIPLLAPRSGVVKEILVVEGEAIGEDDVAVILG